MSDSTLSAHGHYFVNLRIVSYCNSHQRYPSSCTRQSGIDRLGISVIAVRHNFILQQQQSVPSPSPPSTSEWPGCKITLWNAKAFQNDQRPSGPPYQFNTLRPEPDSDFFDPVRVERRRKVREEMKELYPNGVPDPYVFTNAQFRKGLHFVYPIVLTF
ncbi:hypothetical protein M378DRAFT_160037 [Amanita muscaria Koide BX008]|uniref:Uncharacterized protein n=1 Tax=Amanita muscaria (strain Koide BX008) TaxID=946122 RepID=A0A0C2XE06_AMAMK|nr:hypothetical protein M378DRAFT_160037 [Amanita muscaria Koide BX008]